MNEPLINLTNLVFFSGNGIEIPVQKTYSITWKIIPCNKFRYFFDEVPSGFITGRIGPTTIKNIDNDELTESTSNIIGITEASVGIINGGKIKDFNNFWGFVTDQTTGNISDNTAGIDLAKKYIKLLVFNADNKIELSIDVRGTVYQTTELSMSDIFKSPAVTPPDMTQLEKISKDALTGIISSLSNIDIDINRMTVSKGTYGDAQQIQMYTNENIDYFSIYSITSINNNMLAPKHQVTVNDNINWNDYNSSIAGILTESFPNIASLYPFFRISGTYIQEQVPAELLSADTILVLQEYNNDFRYPVFDTTDTITKLVCAFNADAQQSEYSFIDADEEDCVEKSRIKIFDFATTNKKKALYFTIGFQSDEEGCYQNFLEFYLRQPNPVNPAVLVDFYFGHITIKSEVIGEDERFRTLLGNFGIPDPVEYHTIFKRHELGDEAINWNEVNEKSKELFMTYTEIFPFAGTYKGLMNAVNFLEYDDIIFKEWYRYEDANGIQKDIAYTAFDSKKKEILGAKLAKYGLSYGEFIKYDKLNRLTMIYHTNSLECDNIGAEESILYKITPDNSSTQIAGYHVPKNHLYKISNGTEILSDTSINQYALYNTNDVSTNTVQFKNVEDIRYAYNELPKYNTIFEYRSSEMLAKLFAVKQWLEKYIIGTNSYIKDITGEGVIFGRMKSYAYVTTHDLEDYYSESYYTPKIDVLNSSAPFMQSEAKISCTLNEFKNITFEDYKDITFGDFIKGIEIIKSPYNDSSINHYISNTFETPVLGEEYEFDITTTPVASTLHEYCDNNELLVYDGEIQIIDDTHSVDINHKYSPLITIERGNLRKNYNDWNSNVVWSIQPVIDDLTGNTVYKLTNEETGHFITSNRHIVLTPKNDNSTAPKLQYTEKNKWHVPMFIANRYTFDTSVLINEFINTIDDDKKTSLYNDIKNDFNIGDSSANYVIEIIEGRLSFANDRMNIGSVLDFLEDNDGEQEINLAHTYHTDRKPFCEYIPNTSIYNRTSPSASRPTCPSSISAKFNNNYFEAYKYFNECVSTGNHADASTIEEFNTYMTGINSSLADEYSNHMQLLNLGKSIKNKIEELNNIFNDVYISNTNLDVSVNHLGRYNVTVKAYDEYNRTYTNTDKENNYTVSAKPIDQLLYINQLSSQNTDDFCKNNINGEPVRFGDIINDADASIHFPKNYGIQYIDFNVLDNNESKLTYDNITYAIDTPKVNDYIMLSNLTEICTGISDDFYYTAPFDGSVSGTNLVKLNMLDENMDRVILYNVPGIWVNLCIYNESECLDVSTIGPFEIHDSSCQLPETDNNYSDQSYINVCDPGNIIRPFYNYYKDILSSGKCKMYVLNATEYNIAFDDIINDHDRNISTFTIPYINVPVFNINDVIKVSFHYGEEVRNETSYRITDISDDNPPIYTLNGRINDNNTGILNDTSIFISYPYLAPVHYMVRATTDGDEYEVRTQYRGYNQMKTSVYYDNNQMFINDYIDNTFNAMIYKYDPANLKNVWINPHDAQSMYPADTSVYMYRNFPVTIPIGRKLFITPDYDTSIFSDGIRYIKWTCSTKTVDDIDNWNDHTNINEMEELFESSNKQLTFKPENFGPTKIEMKCFDKYGNMLVSKGDGLINVIPDNTELSEKTSII